MAEVLFDRRVVRAMRRCLDDAVATGVAENQVRANLAILAERLRRASDSETVADLFPSTVPLADVDSRFLVASEYVSLYVEDRRGRGEPVFVVHWLELRRWS